MRTSLVLVLTAAATLVAGQGFTQEDHAAHHATEAAPAAKSMDGMDAAAMHEMCKDQMGHKMDAKPIHEHSKDKSGISAGPTTKPLSKDEMARMHEKCAAAMSAEKK